MYNLAHCYGDNNQLQMPINLHERCLEIMKLVLAENHPDILISRINLAFSYEKNQQIDDAILLYEQALSSIDENHQRRTAVKNAVTR